MHKAHTRPHGRSRGRRLALLLTGLLFFAATSAGLHALVQPHGRHAHHAHHAHHGFGPAHGPASFFLDEKTPPEDGPSKPAASKPAG